jgi:oxygen-independent coproporphyrinogen-3 oxidase
MPAGIYVHIPFCVRKCPYCDFYSLADRSLQHAYLDALYHEIRLTGDTSHRFDTLYIGGGTPSLFEAGQIASIVERLDKAFTISSDPEVTLEINPGTVDAEKLKAYRAAGVNRLSIGVQSFQDQMLDALGRVHDAKASEDAVLLAQDAGFSNIGLDLIFGIPGQTRTFWETDLTRAISHAPDHLSCYMLTYETETPLSRAVESGHVTPLSDLRMADMMETAVRFLTQSGYVHYEISNYAGTPEKVSRHNSKYWSFVPYIGLGPSAHSFFPPVRRWNHDDIRLYLKDLNAGKLPFAGQETLTRQQQMLEAVYLGLRIVAGIDIQDFDSRFGVDFKRLLRDVLSALSAEQMIILTENRCCLTRKGLLFHEGVVKRMVDVIEE